MINIIIMIMTTNVQLNLITNNMLLIVLISIGKNDMRTMQCL